MYINDVIQLNIILFSVGLGAFIALLYDVYTVINKLLSEPDRLIVLKDIIFCFSSALIVFLFLLVVNNGRMRIYMLPAIIAGFFCWHLSFSTMFIKFLHKVFIRLAELFHITAKLFLLPFRPINCLVALIGGKLHGYLKKYFIKLKNKLKIDLKKI